MNKYSGSDWIETQLSYVHPDTKISPLGKAVADLLGELFYGIYHLDHKALYRVDWANARYIEFSLGWHELATVDFDELTRLVFLAHHFALRVAIEASTHKHLRLRFHQRTRSGSGSHRHPTLDESVEAFKKEMEGNQIPEYQDVQEVICE